MPLILPGHLDSLRKQTIHRFASLWRIERTDGVILLFTDHDRPLYFNYIEAANQLSPNPGDPARITGSDELYTPVDSFTASAQQKQAGVHDHNVEIIGVLSNSAITEDDLKAGRYREAKIVEMLVDWLYPHAGFFYQNIYYIAALGRWREAWQAQVSGVPVWMRRENGDLVSPPCRHQFGNLLTCGVDALGLAQAGTIFSVTDTYYEFVETGLTIPAVVANPAAGVSTPGYYDFGEVTWTSGLNVGLKSEVKTSIGSNIRLQLATPFPINVGDSFTILPGCDHTYFTCINKYANIARFGGQPFIPGNDKLLRGPL